MAGEYAPALPPEISVEGLLKRWTVDDVKNFTTAVLGTRWAREIAEVVPFDLSEVIAYVVEKYIPAGASSYYSELLAVTRDSSARESRVGLDVLDRLSRCRSVSEARSVVDDAVSRYMGLRSYVGLVSMLGPLSTSIPAPPEGIPSVAGPYEPGYYYADGEAAQSLTIVPSDRGMGPLFFTRKNHAWEVEYIAEPGGSVRCSTIVWVLWELIWCILFRFWIPIQVYVGEGSRVLNRFRMSIDYTYVVAYAIQPVWSSDGKVAISLRKIT
jgi:hypothetical protein